MMDIPENVVEAAKRSIKRLREYKDYDVADFADGDVAKVMDWVSANAPDPRIEVVRNAMKNACGVSDKQTAEKILADLDSLGKP